MGVPPGLSKSSGSVGPTIFRSSNGGKGITPGNSLVSSSSMGRRAFRLVLIALFEGWALTIGDAAFSKGRERGQDHVKKGPDRPSAAPAADDHGSAPEREPLRLRRRLRIQACWHARKLFLRVERGWNSRNYSKTGLNMVTRIRTVPSLLGALY